MAKSAIMSLRIVADAKNAVTGMQKASGAVGNFLKVAGAAAVAAAGVALVKYGADAVKMAGDLEQSIGAIDTVFKGNAQQIHDWAKTASTDVGLTRNEYNELGTLIGTQLKNGGTAMDQLAPKTNKLIGLGADLSSMFGGTSKEAIEALSSALKGERDPIERYGVSLNQAKIDAEAAALGFSKVGGSLSDEANQAATLSLIMKQTADAHGNFAKEANTLQGQQQRMNAGWKDIQTTLGTLLLPILTKFFAFINTNILPVLATFADNLAEGGLGGAMERLRGIAEPVFSVIGQLVSQLAPVIVPLVAQFIALASSLSPVSLVMQVLAPIIPVVVQALGQVAGVVAQVLAVLVPLAANLVGTILPVFAQLVSSVIPPLISVIMTLVSAVAPLVVSLASALAPILTSLASTLLPTVAAAIVALVGAIQPVVEILLGLLIPVISSLLPIVTKIFGSVVTVISGALQIVSGVIQVVTGIITGNWSQTWNGIKTIVSGVWNVIKGIVQTGINLVMGIISGVLGLIKGVWSAGWNAVSTVVSGIWSNIKGAAQSFFGGLPGVILGALGNVGNLLVGAGRAIIDGFTSGLRNAWEAGKNFIGGIGDWIAKNKGPISYDKVLLKPAGAAIMGGLVKSMRAAMPDLKKTVDQATGTILGLEASPKVNLRTRTNSSPGGGSTAASARNITIEVNFNGLVTDKVGTAREIRKVLREYDQLVGA